MRRAPAPNLVLSLVAGALLPLSFAPLNWFWLAPVCYAALILSWRRATPGEAFLRGFAFGCSSFLIGIYWIYIAVHLIGGAPVALAVLLLVGLVAAMAFYSGAVGWLAARFFGTEGLGPWLISTPALWVLAEWWRGWFLTGFGWLAAGYSQSDSWLIGFAPVIGLHGVSWAVLVLSGCLVTMVLGNRRAKGVAVLAGATILAAGFAFERKIWTVPRPKTMTVALVQGAVPQELKWLPEQLPVTAELYSRLTDDVYGVDLIVWPEAAIPVAYEYAARYLDEIERRAARAGSAVMLGILRYDAVTETTLNTLVTLGSPDRFYVKRHLVPYGEYYPVPEFVKRWLRRMNVPANDAVPGEPDQPPLALLGERFAFAICYEDVFGAEQLYALPDATVLVNISNDAWFGESIAAPQHLQIARMRAAEVGRYALRSTNTGVTAVIDPKGRIVDQLPRYASGVLESEFRGYTGATPYVRLGNVVVVVLTVLALVVQFAMTKLTIRPGT